MGDDDPIHKNKIDVALAALGLDSKPVKADGKNKCSSVEHMHETAEDEHGQAPIEEQQYWVDGKEYTGSLTTTSSL
jgi:hypothetical protein